MLAVKKMSESHWMILLVLRNKNSGTSPIKEHKVPQISFQEVFLAGYESSWIHLEVGYLRKALVGVPSTIATIDHMKGFIHLRPRQLLLG